MANDNRRNDGLWFLIGVIWAAGLAAGLFGFSRYTAWHGQAVSGWDDLYLTLQLISLNSGALADPIPLELQIARFLLPFLAGATALKALWGVINDRLRTAHLEALQGHVIICGLSRKGLLLAMAFHQQGRQVVIVERDEENDWLEACRKTGMYILLGDAAEPVLLSLAGVKRADSLFAVCDDDGINAAIALQARGLVADRQDPPLRCLAHIDDPRLYSLLKEQSQSLEGPAFQLVLFNVFESGAIRLLHEFPAWNPPIQRPPHIVIVGLGHLGQNLVIHIGRLWWNFRPDAAWKIRISVIDQDARQIIKTLEVRYPQLVDAVLFNPIPLNIHSAEFERGEYFNGKLPDRVYVCLDSEPHVLEAGLVLQQITAGQVPIVLRMAESKGLAELLAYPVHNLYSFILLERICTPDLLKLLPRDVLAEAVHADYLRTRPTEGDAAAPGPAQKLWDELAPSYRSQVYELIRVLLQILKDSGYAVVPLVDWVAPSLEIPPEKVRQMAAQVSQSEVARRAAMGWWYMDGSGPDSPSLNQSSAFAQERYADFIRNLPAFLSRSGYQLKSQLQPAPSPDGSKADGSQ